MSRLLEIIEHTKVFRHEKHGILRILVDDDEIWVCVRDVLRNIGLERYLYRGKKPPPVLRNLSGEFKVRKALYTPGGVQPLICVTERGLEIILKDKGFSDFQTWLSDEVLPRVRKRDFSGCGYLPTDKIDTLKARPQVKTPGHLYVFYDKERNICKIGKSTTPRIRIQSISTNAAILDYYSFVSEKTKNMDAAEHCAHDFFEKKRIQNTEWFRDVEYLEVVKRVKNIVNMVGKKT